jgi:hypothetical protein
MKDSRKRSRGAGAAVEPLEGKATDKEAVKKERRPYRKPVLTLCGRVQPSLQLPSPPPPP